MFRELPDGRACVHLIANNGILCCPGEVRPYYTDSIYATTCPECLSIWKVWTLVVSNTPRPNVHRASIMPSERVDPNSPHGVFFKSDVSDYVRPAVGQALLRCGYHARCAEVGCQFGEHAKIILDLIIPSIMVLIDPWLTWTNGSESYYEENFTKCQSNLSRYNQCQFIRERSQSALPKIPDDTFDFVYIDGDHSKDICEIDIRESVRITRLYGLVGGHDYGLAPQTGRRGASCDGVAAALNSVFDGYLIDSMGSDWWVVITPEVKEMVRKL